MKNLMMLMGLILTLNVCAQDNTVHMYYKHDEVKPQQQKRFSPFLAGGASYLVTGLGQMYCKETGRGFAFIAASLLAGGVVLTGLERQSNARNPQMERSAENLLVGGIAALYAIKIASIVDAVRLAKAKNLNSQPLSYRVKLRPYTAFSKRSKNMGTGLKFTMSF
jgi:hypothetical protein